MQVTIKYFASLRELMGESSRIIDIDEKSSVDDIWRLLTDSKQIEFDNVMATINMEYVKKTKNQKRAMRLLFSLQLPAVKYASRNSRKSF